MAPSLQQRMWGGSAGVTLAALLVFFFISDRSFRSTIRAGVEQSVRAASTLALEVRSSRFDDAIRRTAELARDPRLKGAVDTQDPATITHILQEARSVSGSDWLTVLSVDGVPLASTRGAPAGALRYGENFLHDARFYDTGDVWLTDDGVVDVMASPVLFGTLAIGILVAGDRLDPTDLADIETYVQQRLAIVAHGRVVVGDSVAHAVTRSRPSAPTAADLRTFTREGETFLSGEVPLVDASGEPVASMVVFQSLDAALAPAHKLRFTLLGIGLGALGLAFLLAFVVARGVTAPVERLLGDAQRLGEGDLDHPVLPMRRDEIGELAVGFDRMRTSLRSAQDELIRSERLSALGQMASSIVHDFSNPLSTIRMSAELMQLDAESPAVAQDAAAIVAETDRMNTMMREVLEFARGNRTLEVRQVDVGAWMADVRRSWAPLLEARRITLHVRGTGPQRFAFDPDRLRRAVDNLIKNAQGAVGPGATIRVSAARTRSALRLEVADDGDGIPAELHETLFQPFTTHGKKNGTGLGLAICKSVVERHSGSIRFESSSSGTTFTIDIPEGVEPCVDAA